MAAEGDKTGKKKEIVFSHTGQQWAIPDGSWICKCGWINAPVNNCCGRLKHMTPDKLKKNNGAVLAGKEREVSRLILIVNGEK